ncbi:hypothetical protein [Metapseudomonas otitidis]|uniref:hypothetical protein n=1 Tax=Metapseudomonas otitidis TaxID=319939 RepID=UPI001F0E2E54|nr:hypothetical protein [Pseudomonas otitidis]
MKGHGLIGITVLLLGACMSRLFLGICLLLLASGCARTSTPDTIFRFEGALPKDFGLWAQAVYVLPEGCEARRRELIRDFEAPFGDQASTYRFDIPVQYSLGGCQTRLVEIEVHIRGRHGPLKWQKTYDDGSLRVVEPLPAGAPDFDAAGLLHKQAHCGWWFQLSSASSRRGEIEKLLNCQVAEALIPASRLVGKTVRLDVALDREEEPSYDRRWVKTPAGWKPCQGTETSERCQTPPAFKTFKMNGRTCTVYPSCTE